MVIDLASTRHLQLISFPVASLVPIFCLFDLHRTGTALTPSIAVSHLHFGRGHRGACRGSASILHYNFRPFFLTSVKSRPQNERAASIKPRLIFRFNSWPRLPVDLQDDSRDRDDNDNMA